MQGWKHIAVLLDGSPAGERIGRRAGALAQRFGAHLVGIYGVSRQDINQPADSFVRGLEGVQSVLARRHREESERVEAAAQRFTQLVQDQVPSCELRIAWRDGLDGDVLRHLHCDLVVAAHPRPRDLPDEWSAEHVLMHNGGPLLLIPDAWPDAPVGEQVLVAWNGSPRARRAVNDAMPFLRAARAVTILVVDAHLDPERYGETPSADIQAHLARHGVSAAVRAIRSEGGHIAQTIAAQAVELGADLTVIGAYSRPRATEIMFGGVTRTLLARTAPGPLLISH